jgi:hypothetical protein
MNQHGFYFSSIGFQCLFRLTYSTPVEMLLVCCNKYTKLPAPHSVCTGSTQALWEIRRIIELHLIHLTKKWLIKIARYQILTLSTPNKLRNVCGPDLLSLDLHPNITPTLEECVRDHMPTPEELGLGS